jgi:Cu2+-exporting ATPase/Cu+-exporting ATPase
VSHSPTECLHCGLPVSNPTREEAGAIFCCYGCEIAHSVLGAKGDEASAKLAMYKFAAGCILGINVMMFSMPLYVESFGHFFSQGFGAERFFEMLKWLLMALSLPVYFLLGMPFVESTLTHLRNGFKTNADSLIAIGVTAALLISIYNTVFTNGSVYYETAVGILVIVSGGRYLESKARAKATHALGELENILPDEVTLVTRTGSIINAKVSSLHEGDIIRILPGSIVPVDSIIRSGTANVSQAILTGESSPIQKSPGDEVLSGSTNYDGLLTLEVLRAEKDSFVAKLETLLGKAKLGKAHIQETADRVAAIAVPVIMVIALGSFLYHWLATDLHSGLFAFLSVVLIACPCALGIATPAALWVAVSESSKRGVLFRSLGALERLASVQKIFFDKTGTLTRGEPTLADIVTNAEILRSRFAGDERELLSLVQAVSAHSHHPLSRALARALPKQNFSASDISAFNEYPARGVRAVINGYELRLGRLSFVHPSAPPATEGKDEKTTVWCSLSDQSGEIYEMAEFIFEDEVLPAAKEVFRRLKFDGYETMILSGDRPAVADRLAEELDTQAMGWLLPEQKVEIVRNTPASAFAGDGLNDAAAIAAAQVGIAFSHGADITRTEADVVIFERNLEAIPEVLSLSKKTMKVVRQNLLWAFGYNAVGVFFAAMGMLTPIISALAMVLSSAFVIQNSLRLRGVIETETV